MARRVGSALASRLPSGVPGVGLRFAGGDGPDIGNGDVAATIVVNSRRGLRALASMDATRMAKAYRAGALDVEGSMQCVLALRDALNDRHPVTNTWRFLRPWLFGQISSDKKWIADHDEREADFYFTFLDRRHRCYSQALFESPDEPLEDAQTRKLDAAIEALGLPAGSRVLDVGGGWGAFTEHAGRRGLHVTSLTIARASEQFINGIISAQGLPCRVVREHLMEHVPPVPYDGIVNLGVTEHLPDYPGTLRKYRQLRKPGGRVYLDASATRVATTTQRSCSGTSSRATAPRCACTGTSKRWPIRRSRGCACTTTARATASPRCSGRAISKTAGTRSSSGGAPRTSARSSWYLWGCVDGFERDQVQAYRWVLQLPVPGKREPC